MNWRIEFTNTARKQFRKFSAPDRERLILFLEERVAKHPDPRQLAKRLTGGDAEHWHFRVGQYRIIFSIEDNKLLITVIAVGNRSNIYK